MHLHSARKYSSIAKEVYFFDYCESIIIVPYYTQDESCHYIPHMYNYKTLKIKWDVGMPQKVCKQG